MAIGPSDAQSRINNAMLRSIVENKDASGILDYDFCQGSTMDAAVAVAKILLHSTQGQLQEVVFEPQDPSALTTWYRQQSPDRQRQVSVWIHDSFLVKNLYIYKRFESLPQIRGVFELLLSRQPRPPYLSILTINMMKQLFGFTNDQMAEITANKDIFNIWQDRLFTRKIDIERWLLGIPHDLRLYGGSTNTVLGLYDRSFQSQTFDGDYEACFDLGGGFCTAEINRLTGRSFTSLDLLAPDLSVYDDRLFVRKMTDVGPVCLNSVEMAGYLARQREIPWIKTDISTDKLPQSFGSYLITSAGFVTSTVRPSEAMEETWCSEKIESGSRYLITSLVAIYRIMELVRTGKRVGLFTINRATSRHYTYRTAWLQWENGKISAHKLIPNELSKNDISEQIRKELK